MRRPLNAPSLPVALALLIVLAGGPAWAVTSQTWRQREKADFEKGEPKGVALTAEGALRLSPRLDPLYESGQPYLWALAQDDRGTIYAGGGNDGTIYRVLPSGKSAVFFRAEEPEVHALAVDGAGNVYAGTAPKGRVYKIAPDGSRVWDYDTGEEYVWALVLDRQGNLFAGTGVEGRLLQIDPLGRGRVHFDSAETHIRSLAMDGEGNLIAGTDGHGLVFRISPKGEGFVLYDAPLNEIVSLALAPDGTIYASAAGDTGRGAPRPDRAAPQPPPPAPTPAPPSPEDGPPSPPQQPAQEAQPPSQPPAQPPVEQRVPISMEGKVLAISRDGYAREVWSGNQEAILSLALSRTERLLMGSSVQGRIYALDAEDNVSEVARASSSQVTFLLGLRKKGSAGRPGEAEVAVAGSNFGSVFLLGPGFAGSGTYESRVLDAKSFASWGRASWRADLPKGTGIALGARCGNTEEPDRTWSDWRTIIAEPQGSLLDCPASRFLQWRAELTSGDPARTPVLREVAVTYLPRNLPPEIRKVEVQAPGVAFQKVPSQPGPSQDAKPAGSASDVEGGARKKPRPQSRRGYEPGARTISWQASDPNDDDLVYDVYYRSVEERTWKPIRTRIEEDFTTLDSTAMPDGTYVFRIVGTDAPSNPPGQALIAEKLSDHFDVDNTPPRIESLKAQAQGTSVRLTFAATDTFNIIREVAYAVDAGDWILAWPADGLADSREERYELTLTALAPGEHSIVVRATDAAGNVSAGRTVIEVP
jgi:hypothetical protein